MDDARGLHSVRSRIDNPTREENQRINYLTRVMLLTRSRMVHFNLWGKFLHDVRVISHAAGEEEEEELTLGSPGRPGCPNQLCCFSGQSPDVSRCL